jgi:MFS family permease
MTSAGVSGALGAAVRAVRVYGQRVGGFNDNVKLYLAGAIVRSMAFSVYELFLNLYLLSLGFDAAFIGLANTARGIASLICSLPAGLLADRIGRKRAMIAGLTGVVLVHLGVSVVSQGWAIAGAFVLNGALSPLFAASIAPFLTENSIAQERSTLFTLSAALTNLGGFVSTTVGGYLPGWFAPLLNVGAESALAYRSVMLLSTGVMFLGIVPTLFFRNPPAEARPQVSTARPLRLRFSDPGLLLRLALPQLLFAFGAGLVFPFLNVFFKQRFDVTDATLGWILGITGAMAVPTMLIGGPVADRLGKVQTMLYARALSTPLLLAIGFAPYLPAAVAAHWLRSGFMRVGEPLYMSFAMDQLPERERATGASLMTMSWDAGWSTAPLVSGLVQVRAGFSPLFVATTIVYSLALVAVYGFFVRPARGQTSVEGTESQ